MKISTFRRHLREGVRNLGRNGWMTFASVSAVTVTLLILGVFLVMALNLQSFVKDVENQVEMNVMIKDGTQRSQIDTLEKQIQAMPGVKSVRFVSKEEGLTNLKQRLKEDGSALNGLEMQNPLPDKIVVQTVDPKQTPVLAEKIWTLPNVDKVDYAKQTVEKLFQVTKVVRNVGVAFIIGLMFTAMFLISNTIKITIFARRREIEIMKLVGATNWFIRWPFLVEGVLMGVIGAIIPIVLIAIGYYYVVHAESLYIFRLLSFHPLIFNVSAVMLMIGALIGMWGSVISMRRFLRV
ncbi:cell division protein FtsX [Collibacillus ludicampi]|jgi:cell division transport system permease protein|uniref:Cell division protein FtsX n=1 Tax=Collibacillus ludicampi TaxID=2771369 RepID=A0AAV4LC69_9BACL|nr:permease-like cell division protein FtsX [Collibacillus ludicampi]GIM45360.1 cell division protein FtsX [Collibacillus ludicampi]